MQNPGGKKGFDKKSQKHLGQWPGTTGTAGRGKKEPGWGKGPIGGVSRTKNTRGARRK